MHGFTEDEWIGSLEGSLPPSRRERFDSHLRACGPCARRHARLAALTAALAGAGERMRISVDTGPERLARMQSSALSSVRTDSEARRLPVVRSVEALRRHLGPMCGTGSAERVIRLAARRCAAPGVNELTDEHWPAFIAQLGGILAALCGISPARSIVAAAGRLGMEDAA